ncbi:AAA-associated domain-containing protein [Stygiolobus caldivivus]|uniref:ABC transporter ATP-binding protein n=1 Tax=Stygiolobus caldivivus TaxID=2824673 RepID=A0A8D5ZIA4_9CREN|nr:AAA-associated domain-containing protein [Stygiolobus caldivivus]BCU69421.1 ABC transporter ATP-binding protein [Stygiolobus caldivivus]
MVTSTYKVIHPDARVADLLGLLTTLHNTFDGKVDIYILEKELEVDMDELMPILYAANTMGFINLAEGDIIITDKGLDFIKANIKKRKELLRESIDRLEPFATAKELKAFTVEELLEKLEEKGITTYSSPTGYNDLEIILAEWGIYSGFLSKEGERYIVKTT